MTMPVAAIRSMPAGVQSVSARRAGRDAARVGAGDEERVCTTSCDQREPVQLLHDARQAQPPRRTLPLTGIVVTAAIISA